MAERESSEFRAARAEMARGRGGVLTGLPHTDVSMRRVEEAAARFAATFETAPAAFLLSDLSGTIVAANQEASNLFGYQHAELIGQPIELLVPAASRQRHVRLRGSFTRHALRRPMGTGPVLTASRKDGSEFPVEVGLGRMHLDGSELISSVVLDISERVRGHAAIESLAAIVQSSDDAIIAKTIDGMITAWNPGAERMYGYTAAEAVGQHISIVCPSIRRQEELDEALQRVAQGEVVEHFETTHRDKDGRAISASITISPVHERHTGNVVGFSAIARDVSERSRAAAELADAEEQFRTAFEGAPIGMALLDLAGRFTKVNPAICQITGYTPAQLEGRVMSTLLRPEDLDGCLEQLAEIRTPGPGLCSSELRVVHATGRTIWTAVQVSLIRSEAGTPLRLLAQLQDITDRKHHQDQLQELADHDALTGLLNRRAFNSELEAHAALVSRYGREGALLMIDLDHFKYINDTLGHRAGDQVIVQVSELLSGRLRESDKLARLGGDEFAILLPKTTARKATLVARQLLDALNGSVFTIDVNARALAASIGIATFEPGLSGEDVLVNADVAMYEAKEAGRNRVAVHRPATGQRQIHGRMSWVQQIHHALEEEQFTLFAQPIIDYRSGRCSGHELLIRMIDQNGDRIPPGTFLEIAERLDLIQQIDTWVIGQATRLLTDTGSAALPVSINLSGRSIGDGKVLDAIRQELRGAAIDPSRLIFEITETAAVRHIANARRFAHQLADLGCQLALDDFGAGFGSFYYLKHIPFDYLKIDGEFVANCMTNKTDRLVITAAVSLARGLDKQTIAEYVGDAQTVRLLTGLGVDHGQGFHHGEPVPLEQALMDARHG